MRISIRLQLADSHATGVYSHATGVHSHATGVHSHATGVHSHATGVYSHATGSTDWCCCCISTCEEAESICAEYSYWTMDSGL